MMMHPGYNKLLEFEPLTGKSGTAITFDGLVERDL
jgi:hypothetical protein